MIELFNVEKIFGAVRAVDKINFRIERGEVFGLLGKNGASKTTSIKMLTLQLKPTAGEFFLRGAIVIELFNVEKTFGAVRAVDKINFRIERGEVFGLLGKNGAGKTTSIKMLTLQLKPTAGEIFFEGCNRD